MIKFLQETFLLGGVEALLILLMVFKFNLKPLAKGKLFVTWILLSIALRLCVMITFGIPIITQILMILSCSYILYKIHNINLKRCIMDCFILFFGILLIIEMIWFLSLSLFINMEHYATLSLLNKTLYTTTGRFFEILLIYLYSKGVFYSMGLIWFMGGKKEVEIEEVETTEEEVTEE